jgi:hypothetical protein
MLQSQPLEATPEAVGATAAPAEAVVATPEVSGAVAAPAAPVRPDGLADQFWTDGVGVNTEALVAKVSEYETAERARAEAIPADISGYKLETPEPVLDLAGNPVGFNADDPLAQGVLSVLHKHGGSQALASELLGAYAQSVIAEAKATTEAVQAEVAKLGANAEARISAVKAAVTAHAPAQAEALMAGLASADAVVALEALISKLTGAGIASAPVVKADPFEGLSGAALIEAHRAAQAAGRAA